MPTPPSAQLPVVAQWRVVLNTGLRSEIWATAFSVDGGNEFGIGRSLYLWIGSVCVAEFSRCQVEGIWISATPENRQRIEGAWSILPESVRVEG